MEALVVAAALAGGAGVAAVALAIAWRVSRRPLPAETVSLEVVEEEPVASFVPPKPIAVSAHAPAARLAQPPPPAPKSHPERAPAMVLTHGVQMEDSAFQRRAAPRAPAPPAVKDPPPMKTWAQQVRDTTGPEVQTEWARRQVGPVEPGRVAGACGGCGARLSVSTQRPLRIACPVCGRTKLLA